MAIRYQEHNFILYERHNIKYAITSITTGNLFYSNFFGLIKFSRQRELPI